MKVPFFPSFLFDNLNNSILDTNLNTTDIQEPILSPYSMAHPDSDTDSDTLEFSIEEDPERISKKRRILYGETQPINTG